MSDFNRRHFLMGSGGFMLAIPFLGSLVGSAAFGNTQRVSRFMSVLRRDGAPLDFWPDVSLTNHASLKILGPTTRSMDLTSIQGNISGCFGDKYELLKEHMLMFRSINGMELNGDHGTDAILNASNIKAPIDLGQYETIDEIILRKLYAEGIPATPLNVATSWANRKSYSYYKDNNGEMIKRGGYNQPKDIFDNYFGGITLSNSKLAKDDEKLVIDKVFAHLKSVRNGRKISSVDKERLDKFSDEIFSVQTKLNGAKKISCSQPDSVGNGANLAERIQNTFKVLELVLKCDLTRVINYDFNPDTLIAPYFNGKQHHGLSHGSSSENMAIFAEMHKWHHDFLADFLLTLKEEDPLNPGTSYLDNTLCLLSNEIGSQGSSNLVSHDTNHIRVDVSTVLIGNVNDYFKTGRYLDYQNDNVPNNKRWYRPMGHSYNQLLTTIMNSYGVQHTDWEIGGVAGYGDYRGMKYGKSLPSNMTLGDKRSPLPFIRG